VNTCVRFSIADTKTVAGERLAMEIVNRIHSELQGKGVAVGSVGKGKGCAAGLCCYLSTTIATVICTRFSQEDGGLVRGSLACWEDPTPWWRRRRRAHGAGVGTLADVCAAVKGVLAADARVQNAEWISHEEWAESPQ